MIRRSAILSCCLLWLGLTEGFGQSSEIDLSTFGYFQVMFQHGETSTNDQDPSVAFTAERAKHQERDNSFSVQQLNLFFQTDFSRKWRSFVNFEVLNNFSSSLGWGSFDLDEAWIRYRANPRFILKAGLHVPKFNRLNEIKNRTPLLPYIIRPLVYEESFAEDISIEDYVPERAFAEVEGWLPVGPAKLDYAVYLGNSPNVNSQFDNLRAGESRQTGVDTTASMLVGGRAGLRYGELELGISATRESVNFFRELAEPLDGGRPFVKDVSPEDLTGIPRTRLGADLSYHRGPFALEGEYIAVRYDVDLPPELASLDGPPLIDLSRTFYYGTLGVEINERLLVYASYWNTDEGFRIYLLEQDDHDKVTVEVVTAGARYALLRDGDGFDRILLKAQYANARIIQDQAISINRLDLDETNTLNIVGVAVSVLF